MLNTILPPGQRKDRGLTQDLFGMSSLEGALFNPFWGSGFFDDLVGGPDARYTKSNLNAGTATFTAVAGRHGIARLDPGSTTDNHGGGVQFGAGCLQADASSTLYWETLIRLNTTSTRPQFLVGLGEQDTTLLGATGQVAVDDFIGFYSDGADANIDWHVRVGGVSNVASTSIGSYVDATWLHLGLAIEDGKRFVPFINHVRMDQYITVNSAYAPTEVLAPSWALVGAGTVRPTMDIDWHAGCDTYNQNVRS